MTVTVKNIIPRKVAETSITSQYTASAKTVIDKFTVTNTGSLDSQFSAYLPAAAGTASTSNCVLFERDIASGETYLCPELVGQVIEPSGFIATNATTATLVISASGREIT